MRHTNLKKSFKLALKPLLTAYSKENVDKAMSTFSVAEREAFHRFLVKVMGKLHEIMENEFEAICREAQVGTILDTVEQLVEERSLDKLGEHKANIEDMKKRSIRVKNDEVRLLKDAIEKLSRWNAELQDLP